MRSIFQETVRRSDSRDCWCNPPFGQETGPLIIPGRFTQPEQVDPYAWLEKEQYTPVELFESVHCIPTQAQILSLVWVVPEA